MGVERWREFGRNRSSEKGRGSRLKYIITIVDWRFAKG